MQQQLQQNATTNKKQSVDIQNAIQELLASGLSLAQVWAKIALCKNLFKKGTPEFYSCLGVTPPPSVYEQNLASKPQQPQQPQQSGGQPNVIVVQQPPQPQQQQKQQQKTVEEGFLTGHKGMLLLLSISAIALIILLIQRRR